MHPLSKQVSEYKSLKRSIKELEDRLDAVETEIKDFLGEQEDVVVDGYDVRWKKYLQSRFDSATFKKVHEALYEQFVIKTETRRFTIS